MTLTRPKERTIAEPSVAREQFESELKKKIAMKRQNCDISTKCRTFALFNGIHQN